MTENIPNRTIGGLAPRTKPNDLSRLQRRNRSTQTESDASRSITDPALSFSPNEVAPLPNRINAENRSRMTTYLSARTRDRARAAYRATSHLEAEASWSEFVERAILAEVERREKIYNEGEMYAGDRSPLSPGRPLK